MQLRLLAVFLLLCLGASTNCPRDCSGHGSCSLNGNVCRCWAGWDAGAADCSMRQCPEGVAWADKAYAVDRAHQEVECSAAGYCNRATGACSCLKGFSGAACQRSEYTCVVRNMGGLCGFV